MPLACMRGDLTHVTSMTIASQSWHTEALVGVAVFPAFSRLLVHDEVIDLDWAQQSPVRLLD